VGKLLLSMTILPIGLVAQALHRVHSWTPDLPRPADWLTKTEQWVGQIIQTRPRDACVAGTNSRFDGRDARQLFAELQAKLPGLSNDLVFCHGDYCLPNVLMRLTPSVDPALCCPNCSRRTNFWILPNGVRGNASTKSHCWGAL